MTMTMSNSNSNRNRITAEEIKEAEETRETREAERFAEAHEGLTTKGPSAAIHLSRALRQIFPNGNDELLFTTPDRIVRYLNEFNNEYMADEVLGSLFDGPEAQGIGGMVVQSNIPFRMICEHHLLPAIGKAHIGYIPSSGVVGLSKLSRLVEAVGTSRPSLQELICEEIANVLEHHTKAKGVMVIIDSIHTCMAARGANVPNVTTSTSCVRGVFRDVPSARTEFMGIVSSHRK